MEDNKNTTNSDNLQGLGIRLMVTQDTIVAGSIKPRHLQPAPTVRGDMYVSDGTNFVRIAGGTVGQMLLIIGGTPTWGAFPQTGIATARPTVGRFTGDMYFSLDSHILNVWDGAVWRVSTFT